MRLASAFNDGAVEAGSDAYFIFKLDRASIGFKLHNEPIENARNKGYRGCYHWTGFACSERSMPKLKILLCLLTMMTCSSRVAGQLIQEANELAELAVSLDTQIPQQSAENIQADADELGSKLSLADVVASVYRYFPLIQQARIEAGIADGQMLSAMGAYDTRLSAYSLSQPQGFYRTYRHGLGAVRQTWWGGYVTAGYRVGRGQFEPWYKERETNRGGEFSLGMGMPLLQGRAIDPQRVEVFRSGLAQQAVGPGVQLALLDYSRDAASLYWDWVAAGARLLAQQELLQLAKMRQGQLEDGANAGKYANIDVVFNRQLVAQRVNRRLDAEQRFRAAGFNLSLYLRDPGGQSLIPDDDWLPRHFPEIAPVPSLDFNSDFQSALSRRPELSLLAIERQQVALDRQLANNQRLPNLDLMAEASQDMGQRVSAINDKGPLELLVGIQSDVPIQRRNALGKIQQANAKLSQIEQKTRFQQDKIAVELRTAMNALVLAEKQVAEMEVALKAAFETLQGYRFGFERGFTDLVQLNLLETQTNEVELLLVDVQRGWFVALAQMQAALGVDPLEQALMVAALPESTRIGPGDFPMEFMGDQSELETDWKLHQQSSSRP